MISNIVTSNIALKLLLKIICENITLKITREILLRNIFKNHYLKNCTIMSKIWHLMLWTKVYHSLMVDHWQYTNKVVGSIPWNLVYYHASSFGVCIKSSSLDIIIYFFVPCIMECIWVSWKCSHLMRCHWRFWSGVSSQALQ